MTVEAASANWLTLVMSSAVISAFVNVIWSARSKYVERKREDKKDAKRIGHVYLNIALSLESFGKQCDARLFDIENGLWQRARNHDESFLSRLKPFTFAFDPEPTWSELPIPFVAKVKVLPEQFESTSCWIGEQWSEWADLGDAYDLETERVAFYGLKAFEIAAAIRREIQAGECDTESHVEHFRSIIEQRRDAFRKQREGVTLLPELHAQFNREVPPQKEPVTA